MSRTKLVNPHGVFTIPVIADTREQQPYTFEGLTCDSIDGGGPLTVPVIRDTIDAGDYALQGYTGCAVERKSLQDLYGTIGQGRNRFERELERLSKLRFAAVVIEATWPEVCAEPPPHTMLPPKTVFRSILAWMVRYPTIHWMPCGDRRLAEVTTFRLLERYAKETLAVAGRANNDNDDNENL